jgi:hypothetical protein
LKVADRTSDFNDVIVTSPTPRIFERSDTINSKSSINARGRDKVGMLKTQLEVEKQFS